MKVGIMSMQRVPNYGSYLQALGLKLTIEELGHEVEFVDYTVEECINHNVVNTNNNRSAEILEKIGRYIRRLLGRQTVAEKYGRMMKAWENSYKDVYLRELGITNEKKYRLSVDTLLIGSDEVFNCLQSNPNVGYSKELFGKNNNSKRLVTYAASCGNTSLERLEKYGICDEVGEMLKRFDAVSVRDANTFNVVKGLTDSVPLQHLDPVLVSDFSSVVEDNVTLKDYIIVYGYSGRIKEEEQEVIIRFAKEKNKKLVCISGMQLFCDEYITCKPEEVISYFKHSSYVITDTFHGSILSIINEKPFLTIVRPTIGESYGNSEKLTDLLERLDLKDRIIMDFDNFKEKMDRPIDYDSVRKIRQTERLRTIDYLKNNL